MLEVILGDGTILKGWKILPMLPVILSFLVMITFVFLPLILIAWIKWKWEGSQNAISE
jgi:hypothetical protein